MNPQSLLERTYKHIRLKKPIPETYLIPLFYSKTVGTHIYFTYQCTYDGCSNKKLVHYSNVEAGRTVSCGCFGRKRLLAKPGERHGILTVIKYIGPVPGKAKGLYLMRCDCGRLVKRPIGNLRNGKSSSCGCLHIPLIRKAKTKDLTGLRFNRLLVSGLHKVIPGKAVLWNCLCDCGKKCVRSRAYLTHIRKKPSCGCLRIELNRKLNLTHRKTTSFCKKHGIYRYRARKVSPSAAKLGKTLPEFVCDVCRREACQLKQMRQRQREAQLFGGAIRSAQQKIAEKHLNGVSNAKKVYFK